MSKFDQELRARLASGENPEEVARWYMHVIVEANLDYDDLSPFERKFWEQMNSAYERWKRQRRLN